jgi:threonine/homoserine/homoserine lactone efflux protein
MPSDAQLLAFLLTALALIAIPGPSVLFAVSRSLTLGRRAGLATVAGDNLGIYVQMLAIAVGLGTLVERSVTVFTVLKLAGAAYLVYLGVQAIRHRRSLAEAFTAQVDPKSTRRILLDGFAVGISNPKSVIFFAAILPQFVNRAAGHVPLQMMLLGAVFSVAGLLSDGTWALAAGAARAWLSRKPARLAAVGGAGGLAMIGIGVRLAVSGRSN